MHLLVFGATGGTGQQIVACALAAGHGVTAVVRDPSRIAVDHERLRAVRGDVLDLTSLAGCADGADAVLSALGTGRSRAATTVYSAGIANILEVMRHADVRRVLAISALPVTPRDEVGLMQRRIAYPILYRRFGAGYADMARMEKRLHESDAEWTVVRPPRLTDGPATGSYRAAVNAQLPRAGKISRADLAHATLDLLEDPAAVHATIIAAH